MGRKSDILKAESDLTEAEFERDSYQTAQNQSRNKLAMLTGLPGSKLFSPADPWDSALLISANLFSDSIYARALAENPELQITNNLTFIQQARIKETQADLYPRLSVNGGYNWNYNALTQQQKGWYSTLSLQWTIFNGNERRYRIKAEKIRSDVYQNQKLDIENTLSQEVQNEILNIKNAENQIRTTSDLMKTTQVNLELAQAEYQAGTGTMLELTVARITHLNALKRYNEGITTFLIAVANLERLTGG
jgi:outer membrane protein TolC